MEQDMDSTGTASAQQGVESHEHASQPDSFSRAAASLPTVRFDADGLAVPPELSSLSPVLAQMYNSLSEEDRDKAKSEAAELSFNDRMSIIDFGTGAQSQATSVVRQLGQHTKTFEVGEVGDMVLALRKHQERLGIGELKTHWWNNVAGKVGLTKFADPLGNWLSKQESIGAHLDQVFDARQKERDEMIHLREIVAEIRNECITASKQLNFDIVTAGLALTRAEADFRELAKQNRNTQDPDKIRELEQALISLVMMDRKIMTLKASRALLARATKVTDEQEKMIFATVQMFGEDTLVKQLWETAVAEAVTTHKIKKAVTIIKDSRDAFNRILNANSLNLESTVQECMTQLSQGIIDPAIFRGLIARTVKSQEAFVKGVREARPKLKAQGEEFDRLLDEMNQSSRKYAEEISNLTV